MKRFFLIGPALFLSATIPALAADWPQWRGPHRDGKSGDTGLLQEWPASGPSLVWKAAGLGKGFGSVSTHGDRLYAMGDESDANYLMAFNVENGKVLWSTKVGKAGKCGPPGYDFAGPRCTPTIEGDIVVGVDQWGELVCANAADGKELWRKNYLADLGSEKWPDWGYSESPLVDGNQVVVTPGGPKGTIAALEVKTGKVLWQTKDFTDPAHYSSIVIAEIGGVRQYVQLTPASVVGVSPKDGTILWKAPRKGNVAVIPTPIVWGNDVYVSSGYGVGCNLFEVKRASGDFTATQVYANKVMANHHGGVILVGEDLYGYSEGKGLMCQDFKTGKDVWAEKEKIKKGAVSFADGMLYVREEDSGTVVLVQAAPNGYVEKGRFLQPDRSTQKAWAHPSIANGKLYLRDQDLLLSYNVKR